MGEAETLELRAVPDPLPENPEHFVVDYRPFPEKQQKAKAKVLSVAAIARGCLFQPVEP